MRRLLCAVVALTAACSARADVTLENVRFRLVVGDDAIVRSLRLKATGEELLDVREPTPLFSVTQPRPFNNEIKLAYPNARTTYPANRLRRDGDRLVVGFEIAPYEAAVDVKVTDDYIAFTLADFILTEKSYPLCPTTTVPLDFTAPPVDEFCLVQLPVRNRANFGEWLNVQWDGAAAVGVFSTSEHALVSSERRAGYRVMRAVADRSVRLRGTGAALVVDAGGDAILDRLAALESDYGLPQGVANRRHPLVNASIYFASDFSPSNAARHIDAAKRGGFRLMLISAARFFSDRGDWSLDSGAYPNGIADVKRTLDEIHAAGLVPGVHVLHTFLEKKSVFVKGGADRRIALREHYTLARPLGPADTEVYVDENPQNAERSPRCRILKFGRELMTYEGFTTERPYRFTGVTRGYGETPAAAHEEGLIGGTAWVCEYGGQDFYLKQDSDLQDVRAEIFGAFWKAGMRFVYFDGSEGVQPPYAFHVPNAQYRMWKRLDPQPLLGEGAAKAHFGWHMLSGANAFDVFAPEEFKEKIVEYPLAEAPLMRQDFTRVNFGWWGFWEPGATIRGVRTMGVQPDMWEYGTSKAAAWDSPASVQMRIEAMARHPRIDDILEVMRRWEDVRAKGWLTDAQKEALRVPGDEYHLVQDERDVYHLVKLTRLPSPPEIRAWSFVRDGWRTVLYSHVSGTGEFRLTLPDVARGQVVDVKGGSTVTQFRREGDVFVLPAGPRRYFRYQTAAEAARRVAPTDVPELMKTDDGRPVADRATWERVRRPEIRETFLRELYGKRPVERPSDLSFAAEGPDRVMMDGQAVRKRIRVSYGGPYGKSSFVLTAFIPAGATAAKPAPAFLLICNRDPKKNLDPDRVEKSGFWPAEQIVARGYAALAFFNGDLARDGAWDFTNGVFGVFQKVEERTPESWGILSAWAWGASRVMDWIETEPTLDARHVAVVGHSRGGKTALLTGVTDARFAMACVNDSGCGGAKLNHMDLPLSEHYDQIAAVFGPWFCGNFMKHRRKEHLLPFDAHMWAALMAPRLLAIGSATEDHWAGQEGEFQTGRLASPAWELYGRKGLVGTDFPPPDTPLQEGSVSYHLRTGIHNLTPYDWDRYMDFADRQNWR